VDGGTTFFNNKRFQIDLLLFRSFTDFTYLIYKVFTRSSKRPASIQLTRLL